MEVVLSSDFRSNHLAPVVELGAEHERGVVRIDLNLNIFVVGALEATTSYLSDWDDPPEDADGTCMVAQFRKGYHLEALKESVVGSEVYRRTDVPLRAVVPSN